MIRSTQGSGPRLTDVFPGGITRDLAATCFVDMLVEFGLIHEQFTATPSFADRHCEPITLTYKMDFSATDALRAQVNLDRDLATSPDGAAAWWLQLQSLATSDADLQLVMSTWKYLPEAIQKAISLLVQANVLSSAGGKR